MPSGTAYRTLFREAPQLTPLVAGYATSAFGDAAQSIALLWLAARPPVNPWRVGIIALAFVGPGAVAGPLLAAVGDAVRLRRDLLIGCDFALALLAVALSFLVTDTPFWAVAVDVAAMSVIEALASATYAGALPEVVGTEHLSAANGVYRAAAQLAGVAGAAAGGVLITTSPASTVFIVNAATFVISAWALLRVPGHRFLNDADSETRTSYTESLSRGWHFLRGSRPVRLLTAIGFLGTIGFSPAQVVLVLLIRTQLHAGSAIYGAAQAMIWIGLSAGTVIGGSLPITKRPRLLGGTYLALALFTVGLGLAVSWWIALVFVFARAGANGVSSLTARTLLQQHTPASVRSGVMGTVGSVYEVPRLILLPTTAILVSTVGVRVILSEWLHSSPRPEPSRCSTLRLCA